MHAGCSVKKVQAALGHKSAKVTLDVYGRLWPGEEDPSATPSAASFAPTSCEARKAETHASNRASAAASSWRAQRTQLVASAALTSTLS